MNFPNSFPSPGMRPPVAKGFRDGTHRLTDPDVTFEKLRPMLPEMGITRIANVTGLDILNIPVYMVCRPNSRSVAVSQGKGLSAAAARVSGVMESIELWHAEHIMHPVRLATMREMSRSFRVIDVTALPRRARSRYHDDLPMLWIAGYDILSQEVTWAPYECVTMNSTLPLPTGSGCFLGTSNGLASGNDPLEALSHALCEIIERDATTLWRVRGESESSNSLIHLDTIDDIACRKLIEQCARVGVHFLVWDMTSDVGVPAFAALMLEPSSPHPIRSSAIGYGCHSERGIALLRGMTEAIQSRLTFIAGSRDDLFRREYEDCFRTRASIERFTAMLSIQAPKSFRDVETLDSPSFDHDVAHEMAGLQKVGVRQIVAIELTDPRFKIPVVRAIVPGLEGPDSDPDYAMGARAIAARKGATL